MSFSSIFEEIRASLVARPVDEDECEAWLEELREETDRAHALVGAGDDSEEHGDAAFRRRMIRIAAVAVGAAERLATAPSPADIAVNANEAARLAIVVDAHSPEQEAQPAECALLDKLLAFVLGRPSAAEDLGNLYRLLEERAPERGGSVTLGAAEQVVAQRYLADAVEHVATECALLARLRGAEGIDGSASSKPPRCPKCGGSVYGVNTDEGWVDWYCENDACQHPDRIRRDTILNVNAMLDAARADGAATNEIVKLAIAANAYRRQFRALPRGERPSSVLLEQAILAEQAFWEAVDKHDPAAGERLAEGSSR